MNTRQMKEVKKAIDKVVTAKLLATQIIEIRQEIVEHKCPVDAIVIAPHITVGRLTQMDGWQTNEDVTQHMIATLVGRLVRAIVLSVLGTHEITTNDVTAKNVVELSEMTTNVEKAAFKLLHPTEHVVH